jgi:hypothetical protein
MASGAKGKAAKAPKPVIPTIDWIGNNNTLIWKLLNEIEKKQNCSVLYGPKVCFRALIAEMRTDFPYLVESAQRQQDQGV